MVDNISTSSKSSGLLGGRLPEAVWRHFIKGGKISPGKHTAPAVTVLNPFQLDFMKSHLSNVSSESQTFLS